MHPTFRIPLATRTRRLVAGAVAGVLGVSLLTLAPTSVTVPTADAAGCTSTPFRKPATAAGPWYRLPSLVKAPSGALVAFAEARDNNRKDDMGNFDIVRATSYDNGCSWTPPVVVQDDGTNRVSNPHTLVDYQTGTIFLFTTIRQNDKNYGYVTQSADNGETWSPRVLLTDANLKNADLRVTPRIYDWRNGLMAPGNGIQLKYGAHAGRLIFLSGYTRLEGGWGKVLGYGGAAYYSDDHGVTWHKGFDVVAPKNQVRYIEASIAERSDGTLFVTYRDKLNVKGKTRLVGYSKDGGQTLVKGKVSYAAKLPMVSVYANAFVPTGKNKNLLIMTAPAFVPTKKKDLKLRKYLGLYISTNGGKAWRKAYIAKKGYAGYASTVQLNDDTVGVLYETGKKVFSERIDFTTVSLSKAMKATKAKKKK